MRVELDVKRPEERLEVWEGRPVSAWARDWRVPELIVLGTTASTNDVARALAGRGAPAGATIIAEEQSAGRGSHGRVWRAPYGRALLLSMLLRPRLRGGDEARAGTLPLRAGLAAARAIEDVTGQATEVKWPNDVLLHRRKVAGVLCEGTLTAGPDAFLVVGVGINVLLEAGEFPPELRPRATSLRLALGRDVSRGALAGALVARLRDSLAEVHDLDDEELAELGRRDALRGRALLDDAGDELGIAVGVARDGTLQVRLPSGIVRRVVDATVRAREDGNTGASMSAPES